MFFHLKTSAKRCLRVSFSRCSASILDTRAASLELRLVPPSDRQTKDKQFEMKSMEPVAPSARDTNKPIDTCARSAMIDSHPADRYGSSQVKSKKISLFTVFRGSSGGGWNAFRFRYADGEDSGRTALHQDVTEAELERRGGRWRRTAHSDRRPVLVQRALDIPQTEEHGHHGTCNKFNQLKAESHRGT